ncbi:unnamed protein product [Cuscuta campestris]|uniref:STL11/RBM22-like N-terminal domain-containing protein n=1 Tax=Cuscuta campestris TaxID=132261 RepID=A0A484KW67_9ASTE|nr:unnamed protein product [Cuscuta campestris]
MEHQLRLRDSIAESCLRSNHPILCQFCFGDNPRVTEAPYDNFCKTCARPFTRFRWRPYKDGRYKKTEICKPCCGSRLICQGCSIDLFSLLPDQVRDTAVRMSTNHAVMVKADEPLSEEVEAHDHFESHP